MRHHYYSCFLAVCYASAIVGFAGSVTPSDENERIVRAIEGETIIFTFLIETFKWTWITWSHRYQF